MQGLTQVIAALHISQKSGLLPNTRASISAVSAVIRFVQPRALGRKVSDEFTLPLCRIHHRELHRVSDELN